MAKKFLWKLWLRLNLMTKDVDNDYYAEVSTAGHTMRNEDLAQRIIDEGSEIKFDTLLSIFNHGDRLKREALLAGTSVLDGIAHYAPRVTGNWVGATHRFDPDAHRLTLDISPTVEMRKALAEEVDVEVLGIRDSGAYIGLVTDLSNGKADGKLHRGTPFAIEGNKIKVYPVGDDRLGVFLRNAGQPATPAVKIATRLIQNDPKRIVALLPADLATGAYELTVVTRFTNSRSMLNDPRTIAYAETLTVL